ncbi:MAG TPA: hypothetical protein VGF17_17580, partial [Phytomonospora sp.]
MSRSDLAWFPDPPGWLLRLHESRVLDDLGASWLDAAGRLLLTEADGRIPVASGPPLTDLDGTETTAHWLAEPGPSGRLWLAPSQAFHPHAWIPVGTTEEAVAATAAHYFPAPRPTRLELPRELRVFIGYRHEIGDM